VVAAAFVVELRRGPALGLLDQAVGQHALDRSVERAGARSSHLEHTSVTDVCQPSERH
jgi:hypothetical protein